MAVIGVGSIGGPIAAHLTESDIDVTVVTKHPDLATLIQSKGLKLQGVEESRHVPMKAVPLITDLEGAFDIVFLAMKAFDVKAAAQAVLPYLSDDSVVVTLQNGIVEDEIANIVGKHRVVGAVVFWGSEMVEPGVIQRNSDGLFVFGLLDEDGNQHRLSQVKSLLGSFLHVDIADNIYSTLYSKLTLIAWLNGLQALCGQPYGEMQASKRTRQLGMGIIAEAVTVADHLGIKFVKLGGLDLQSMALSASDSPEKQSKKHDMVKSIGQAWDNHKSSSLQSLERGGYSEVEYFNGYIAKKGKELGIETPINTEVVRVVKEIEDGKRKILPDNLLELPDP
ncbi:MAG: ketopantoate reductase family protein [Candidatus Heimdallarchaeota archaeon]